MADDIDRASQREQELREEGMAKLRRASHLKIVGFCHNCGESSPGKLFCCTECRDDYDHRRDVKNKTGG